MGCTAWVACLQEEASEALPTAAHQPLLDSNTSGRLGADLTEALPLLCGNGLPQALQAAFQLADPGFSAPMAQALQVLYCLARYSVAMLSMQILKFVDVHACNGIGSCGVSVRKVPCMYGNCALVLAYTCCSFKGVVACACSITDNR